MKTVISGIVLICFLAVLKWCLSFEKQIIQAGTEKDQLLLFFLLVGFVLQVLNGITCKLPMPPGCMGMVGKIGYFTYFSYTICLIFYYERVMKGYYIAEELYAIRTISLAMFVLYLSLVVSAEVTRVQDILSHVFPVTITMFLDTASSVQNYRYVCIFILPLYTLIILSVGGIRRYYPVFPSIIANNASFVLFCFFSSIFFCFFTEPLFNLIHEQRVGL